MERFKVTMTRTYVTELHYNANNRVHAEDLCKSDDSRFAAELEQCNVVSEEYESEHCPKKPTSAACWVLVKGAFGEPLNVQDVLTLVEPFLSMKDAQDFVRHSDDYSLNYSITESVDVLRDYCDEYMMDWTKFIHIKTY